MSDLKFGEWCEMVREGKIELSTAGGDWRYLNIESSSLLTIFKEKSHYRWRIKEDISDQASEDVMSITGVLGRIIDLEFVVAELIKENNYKIGELASKRKANLNDR